MIIFVSERVRQTQEPYHLHTVQPASQSLVFEPKMEWALAALIYRKHAHVDCSSIGEKGATPAFGCMK